jgi:hypothetical protein
MLEPSVEMLDYAKRHGLRYNPARRRSGWCFENVLVDGKGVQFAMSYAEVEQLCTDEAEESGKVPDLEDV